MLFLYPNTHSNEFVQYIFESNSFDTYSAILIEFTSGQHNHVQSWKLKRKKKLALHTRTLQESLLSLYIVSSVDIINQSIVYFLKFCLQMYYIWSWQILFIIDYFQVRVVLLPLKKQKYKSKIRNGENPQYMESFVFHKINPGRFHFYTKEHFLVAHLQFIWHFIVTI